MPRTKQTPLAEDKNLVKSLMDLQPNPMETFKKHSYDEMKQALQEWLNPEEAAEEATTAEEPASDLPWGKEDKSPSNYALKTPAKTTSKADKFDELFGEDEEGEDK
jgi:hypothetical protein